MKKVIFYPQRKSVRLQQGAVLIVGLVMLLLMTIVGVAAIRGSGVQENMASNMRDMNISFQAAESALRVCEDLVNPNITPQLPDFNNTNGLFADQNATTNPVVGWDTSRWNANGRVTGLNLGFVAAQPRCVVEELNYPPQATANGGAIEAGSVKNGEQFFRVWSIGYGYTTDTQVVLQSSYKR